MEKLNCPNCNNDEIAFIFWGYPNLDNDIEKAVENKEIVMGGCIVTDHDPKWECTECHHRWGKRDDDAIDSFDYDQGYNLDEVYDQ